MVEWADGIGCHVQLRLVWRHAIGIGSPGNGQLRMRLLRLLWWWWWWRWWWRWWLLLLLTRGTARMLMHTHWCPCRY